VLALTIAALDSAGPAITTPPTSGAPSAVAGAAGRVIWITGLSGAGKTTVAGALASRLRATGTPVIHLDGDALRAVYAEDLGHTIEDRRRIAMRHARMCRLLSAQAVDVVCSTISMFEPCRQWNRAHISRYFEVYLRVPPDELARRDSKGLYGSRQSAPATAMVGRDIGFDEPAAPDLVIDNYGSIRSTDAVAAILHLLDQQPPVPQ
jgi:cytidine diphosphoramidate kinase